MKPEGVRELVLRVMEASLVARRISKNCRVSMMEAVRQFLHWASQRSTPDIRTLGKKDLMAYYTWLSQQHSKRSGQPLVASTIRSRFGVIRGLYSCLYREGLMSSNPAQTISLGPIIPRVYKRRALSKAEISRFLESIDTSTALGLRDRTLFELIYSSGLRVSEAGGLKVGDIDVERRLMVVRGKFDRDRMVPLSEVARDFLLKFLGERITRPDAWVFPGYRGTRGHLSSGVISGRFRTRLREFGMDADDISTHSIRHSTATHLLENGASVRHVQELLGHASIESTVRYTHVMDDGLCKIYRRYHPREHELYEETDATYDQQLARLATGVYTPQ